MAINEYYWKNRLRLLTESLSKDTAMVILYEQFNQFQDKYLNRKPIKVKNICKCKINLGDTPSVLINHPLKIFNNTPVHRLCKIFNSQYKFNKMYADNPDENPNVMEGSMIVNIWQKMFYEDVETYRFYMKRNNIKYINYYDDLLESKGITDSFVEKDLGLNFGEHRNCDLYPDEYRNRDREYYWHDFEYFFRTEIANHKLVLKDY